MVGHEDILGINSYIKTHWHNGAQPCDSADDLLDCHWGVTVGSEVLSEGLAFPVVQEVLKPVTLQLLNRIV